MKATKACFALSFLFSLAMAPAGHASSLTGNLLYLSVNSASYPELAATLDPAQPGITGDLNISVQTDLSSVQGIGGSFAEDSHVIHLNDAGGLSATIYYPNSVYDFSGSTNSYDPDSRTLTLYGVQTSFGAGATAPNCMGSTALCNLAYESTPTLGSMILTLVFDEALLNATGTAIFSHSLDNGTAISGQYNFEATPSILVEPVPVPAAGWLMGTALFGLAGVVRRRRLCD